MLLAQEESDGLLSLARRVLQAMLRNEKPEKPVQYPARFDEEFGVVCELVSEGGVAGIGGVPYPVMSLAKAVMSAVESAFHGSSDTGVRIRLSVMADYEPVRKDYPDDIALGTHGLLLQYGPYQSLILPHEAMRNGWSQKEFLAHLCVRAGITHDMWQDERTKVYRFVCQTMEEA